MKLFFRILRKIEYRYLPTYFRNTLGWTKNRFYSRYCGEMRRIYRKSGGEPRYFSEVGELRRHRLAVLAQVNCDNLVKNISHHFSKIKDSVYSLPQKIAVGYEEDIYNILKEIDPKLKSFYRSYYVPYWIQIQKNNPGVVEAGSAFQWHTDDNPVGVMKVFVYLNDVMEYNGAFRAFPKRPTQWLFFKGFRSNGIQTRVEAQPLVTKFYDKHCKQLRILEGPAGTVLGFDNNLVHKGTLPREGFRHVIQILLYPSNKPLNREMVKKALLSDRSKDYPMNPYKELLT